LWQPRRHPFYSQALGPEPTTLRTMLHGRPKPVVRQGSREPVPHTGDTISDLSDDHDPRYFYCIVPRAPAPHRACREFRGICHMLCAIRMQHRAGRHKSQWGTRREPCGITDELQERVGRPADRAQSERGAGRERGPGMPSELGLHSQLRMWIPSPIRCPHLRRRDPDPQCSYRANGHGMAQGATTAWATCPGECIESAMLPSTRRDGLQADATERHLAFGRRAESRRAEQRHSHRALRSRLSRS